MHFKLIFESSQVNQILNDFRASENFRIDEFPNDSIIEK